MAFAMHIPLTDKYKYAVESPVNATTLNAKTEWSPILIRIEPQGVSSEKRSRHFYFMEDNCLLHAMSKLRHV